MNHICLVTLAVQDTTLSLLLCIILVSPYRLQISLPGLPFVYFPDLCATSLDCGSWFQLQYKDASLFFPSPHGSTS